MKRLVSVLLTASALSLPLIDAPSATAEPASCTVVVDAGHIIRDGHQDVRVLPDGSVIVRDGTTDRPSGTFSVAVPETARTAVPRPGFEHAYFLDQAQDPNLPWFGFSTEEIGSDASVSLEVDGPGRMVAWLTGRDDSFVLDSADRSLSYPIQAGQHVHVNWVFSHPGAYQVTFRIAVDGQDRELQTIFLIGDEIISAAGSGLLELPCPGTRSASTSVPGRLASDITGLTNDFTTLDRAWVKLTEDVARVITPPSTPATPTPPPGTPSPSPSPVPVAADPGAAPVPAAAPAPATAGTVDQPIPDAPQPVAAPGKAPGEPQIQAAAGWAAAPWWSGLSMGIGITALISGLLFFLTSRRILAGG